MGVGVTASDDLALSEAASVVEAVADDGTVKLHLIRPCVGRGKGRHVYSAEMLEENAHKFAGWKMFLNHLSEQARRALGGLPRDVRDTGGIVSESYWDPDVPAEGRFGRGAVVGVVKPVPLIRELLAVDGRLVECSINATATGVKPTKAEGRHALAVEGIEEKGSVDWVTEAGAGGRVAQIMEALIEDGSALSESLDTLDNGTLLAWIEEHRPELAEAMKAKAKKPSGSDTDDDQPDNDADAEDVAEMAAGLLKSGKAKTQAQAETLARQALKQKKAGKSGVSESTEEDELAEITPEVLAEALASDEGKAAIAEAIASVVPDAIRDLNLGADVVALVEASLETTTEVVRAEAEARANRVGNLRDMRDYAHRKIEESKLHEALKEQTKRRFDLVEGVPTPELDLVDDQDADGVVVKSAMAKLSEALDAAVKDGLELQGQLSKTRVRGQGPQLTEAARASGEGDGGGEGEAGSDKLGPLTRQLMENAGIKDPDKVYTGKSLVEAA